MLPLIIIASGLLLSFQNCSGSSEFKVNSTASVPASQNAPSPSTSRGPSSNAQIVLNAMANPLWTVTLEDVGTNLVWYFNLNQSLFTQGLQTTGARVVRWPGGSQGDEYHWAGQTYSSNSPALNQPTYCSGSSPVVIQAPYANGWSYLNSLNTPATPLEIAVTLNYGTSADCSKGGDPAEAAAWVKSALQHGNNVKYWTVGNEVFGGNVANGGWEFDYHDKNPVAISVNGVSGIAKSGDALTYAYYLKQYYQQIKAVNPNAQVGAVILGGTGNWSCCGGTGNDSTVLATKAYDFVEVHIYPEHDGQESDSYLLNTGPATVTATINSVKAELAAAGVPNTPIMVGEFNSVNAMPGKQSLSIVNGLFAGMIMGEMLNDGVSIATQFLVMSGKVTTGNNSSSLYGFQNFGTYDDIISPATVPLEPQGSAIPAGTVMPSGWAHNLVAQFARTGNQIYPMSVSTSISSVMAYGASQNQGYVMMLFNLSENAASTVTVGVSGAVNPTYNATLLTYGKAQYDNSQNNIWTGPVSTNLGSVNSVGFSVTLPPWSMTVLTLQ